MGFHFPKASSAVSATLIAPPRDRWLASVALADSVGEDGTASTSLRICLNKPAESSIAVDYALFTGQ